MTTWRPGGRQIFWSAPHEKFFRQDCSVKQPNDNLFCYTLSKNGSHGLTKNRKNFFSPWRRFAPSARLLRPGGEQQPPSAPSLRLCRIVSRRQSCIRETDAAVESVFISFYVHFVIYFLDNIAKGIGKWGSMVKPPAGHRPLVTRSGTKPLKLKAFLVSNVNRVEDFLYSQLPIVLNCGFMCNKINQILQ